MVDHLKTAVAVEMLPVIPADKLKSADPRKPKPKDQSNLRVRDICNSLLHMLVYQLTSASSDRADRKAIANSKEKEISHVLGNQLFDSSMKVGNWLARQLSQFMILLVLMHQYCLFAT